MRSADLPIPPQRDINGGRMPENPTGIHPDTGEEVELPVDQFDDPDAVEVETETE